MKYYFKAVIVYLIFMSLIVVIKETTDQFQQLLHASILGLFMSATSSMVHHFTLEASKENPNRFPAYFMAISGLKMLAYLVALGIYVFLFQHEAIPIIIAFLALYIVYSILEAHSILKDLKKKG